MAYEELRLIRILTGAVVQPHAEVPTCRTGNSAVYHYGDTSITVQVLNLSAYVSPHVSHVSALIAVIGMPER